MACQEPPIFYNVTEQQPCPAENVSESPAPPQMQNVILEIWRYQASWETSQDVRRVLQINASGQFLRATACGTWSGEYPLQALESWQSSLPKAEMQYFGDKKAMFYAGQPFTGLVLWLNGRKTEYYLSDSIPANPYNSRFKTMWNDILVSFPQVEVKWKAPVPVPGSRATLVKPY
jgi:hypothetical protein